jgi:hypothetical protein
MFGRSRASAFGCRDGLADDTKGHHETQLFHFQQLAP